MSCLLQTPWKWPILGGRRFPNQNKGCNRIFRPRAKREPQPWKTDKCWNSVCSTLRCQRNDCPGQRAKTPPPTWVKGQIHPTAPSHAQKIWKQIPIRSKEASGAYWLARMAMQMRKYERELSTVAGGGRLGNNWILLSFARWGIYCTKATGPTTENSKGFGEWCHVFQTKQNLWYPFPYTP